MQIVAFKLSMPGVKSWNGKWSGEDRLHAIVKAFPDSSVFVQSLASKSYWTHHFGDGWVAGVTAHIIDKKEAASINKRSAGFSGYDWMVDNIIRQGTTQAEE